MKRIRLAALPICALALCSCGGGKPDARGPASPRGQAAAPAASPTPAVAAAPRTGPSAAARRVAERLAKAGGLRVATTASASIYEPTPVGAPAGAPGGFHARLATDFAAWLGIPVRFRTVPFEAYFTAGGKVYGEGLSPPPGSRSDVFRSDDLIVNSLAALPWRAPLMRVIPFLPNRILTVTRKGEELATLRDLAGKRVVVVARTSYESALRALRARLGIAFDIATVPDTSDDFYGEVAAGRADVTLRDADVAVKVAPSYPSLSIGLPISDLQMTGWAVAPGDEELAAAVEEYLAAAGADGSLARIWLDSYGMRLEDYYGLVRYRESGSIAMTDAQRARLEALRASGGIRVAIDTELTVYEPAAGREPGGFHYLLVRRLERDLGLPVALEPVRFDQFFSAKGVVPARAKTDPSYSYTPDLLRRSDLYVGTLSPLPWRGKFLRFVPLFPTTLVYIARPGVKAESPADLRGLRLSLLPNTTYETWLKEREAGLGARFDYVLVDTGRAAVEALAAGRADATISDANLALARLREFKGLSMSPASREVDTISWAVAREDEALGSLLDAWVDAMKASGAFESIWLEYYGVSFAEYLGLIAAGD